MSINLQPRTGWNTGKYPFSLTLLPAMPLSDIRKQEEVLQESYMMVPDSKNRLEQAKEELESLLEQCAEEADVDAELLTEARAFLA